MFTVAIQGFYSSHPHPPPAYFNDIVVGAVCCRVEVEDRRTKLYIMTLGCLAPYRRQGIGEGGVGRVER